MLAESPGADAGDVDIGAVVVLVDGELVEGDVDASVLRLLQPARAAQTASNASGTTPIPARRGLGVMVMVVL